LPFELPAKNVSDDRTRIDLEAIGAALSSLGRELNTLEEELTTFEDAVVASTKHGGVVITWPGGTTTSNLMVIAHSLGADPGHVSVTPNVRDLTTAVVVKDAAEIKIQCEALTVRGTGSYGFVYWKVWK
jgi:hypothetical protein